MKKNVFVLFAIFAYTTLCAQTKESTIGQLLMMNKYDKDTSAEAVIIYDIGVSRFADSDRYGFEIYFNRKCRFKILSPAGLSYAEIEIPLYANNTSCEDVFDFKAKAYNLENGIIVETESEQKGLVEEKINSNWIRKKIAISGAKVGSVIDFEYTVSSPFIFNLQDWSFQHRIPIIYSEYSTRMIPFYSYAYITIGTNKFDEYSAEQASGIARRSYGVLYNDMVYKFVMKNLPAFRDDEFISTPADYMVKIDFQLSQINRLDGSKEEVMTTWPKLVSELSKHDSFGKYVKAGKSYAKEILEANFPSAANNVETLKDLVQYVKYNFSWDGKEDYFAQKKPKNFIKEKSGNDADINLFLVALLNEAGINANPVIISTRDHGRIYKDYPFSHFFNYVIVEAEIDGKIYLSDATENLTTFDQLPERCINEKGLIISDKGEKWIGLTPQNSSVEEKMFTFMFNEAKDSLHCTYTYVASSYDGIRLKNKYTSDMDDFISNTMGAAFDQIASSNVIMSDTVKTFKCQAVGGLKPTLIDSFVLIKPFLCYAIDENLFNKATRNYDIDLTYPRTRKLNAMIMLPQNAVPIKLPKDYVMNNDNISFKYSVNVVDNQIVIAASYSFKKAVYDAQQYQKLHAFFEEIIKTLNQDIQIKI